MSSAKNSLSKKIGFWLLTFTIPILLIGAVEGLLRISGVGAIAPLFKEVELNEKHYLSADRDFANRYFSNTTIVPTAANDVFLKEKPKNSFRVFALGGSSMAGFPYHFNGMMSYVVRDVLEDGLPEGYLVEVVNLGISAVNSYTIYDMLPEVLDHEPDLILFYAGHNEYYGALGVGSSESIGSFPTVIRLYLTLQRWHLFNALKSSIQWILKKVVSKPNRQNATLMEQMVSEQQIAKNSPLFDVGQNQFRSNLEAIISELNENNTPIIMGDLISNLKDFPPFISLSNKSPSALDFFNNGRAFINEKKYDEALDQFIQAKDYDALRFRAPEETNTSIRRVAKENAIPLVEVAKNFNTRSPFGITGKELMLEHLHPNWEGYFLLGWLYAQETAKWMQKNYKDWNQEAIKSEGYYRQQVAMSPFDLRVANYRIDGILSGWPFQKAGVNLPFLDKYPIRTLSDSLALENYKGDANWQQSKEKLANTYVQNGNMRAALLELDGILRPFPWRVDVLEKRASILSDFGRTDEAIVTLKKAYRQKPTVFNTKILGALLLQKNRLDEGLPYLEAAYKMNPKDPQNLYNLSGAYGIKKDFEQATFYIDMLLEIAPNFPGAQAWKSQLKVLTNQ